MKRVLPIIISISILIFVAKPSFAKKLMKSSTVKCGEYTLHIEEERLLGEDLGIYDLREIVYAIDDEGKRLEINKREPSFYMISDLFCEDFDKDGIYELLIEEFFGGNSSSSKETTLYSLGSEITTLW
jgi:hypothetical protein